MFLLFFLLRFPGEYGATWSEKLKQMLMFYAYLIINFRGLLMELLACFL